MTKRSYLPIPQSEIKAVAYTFRCEQCGAVPDGCCLTASGRWHYPLHAKRLGLAIEQLAPCPFL